MKKQKTKLSIVIVIITVFTVGMFFTSSSLNAQDPITPTVDNSSNIKVENITSFPALTKKKTVSMEEIGPAMGEIFGGLMEYMQKNSIEITGPPFAIWHSWDPEGENEMECGIPVMKIVGEPGEFNSITTYEGKAVSTLHIGPYDSSGDTWLTVENYIKENKLKINGSPWEVYLTNPQTEPDTSKWKTKIFQPVK
ncbi:MAG: GyrI-like domain-containing protein [Bacteroidales bacterium]|nr:GyrI-like domain-containing protein [Bacteroidales bacterium]